MFNKINNLSSQTRILIAVLLALAFFIPYSYFYKPEVKENNATKEVQNIETNAINATSKNPQAQDSTTIKDSISINNSIISTIEATNFTYQIDRLGRISQVILKDEKYKKDGQLLSLFNDDIANPNNPKILEIRFADSMLNNKALNTPYSADNSHLTLGEESQTLTLKQDLDGIIIEKIITFYPNGAYKLKINIPQNYIYFISPGMRPSVENEAYVFKGVIVKEADSTITTIEDGDAVGQENFSGARFLAASDRYYTTMLYSESGMQTMVLSNAGGNPMPFISGNGSLELSGYVGPKDYRLLESINKDLTDVVEYGVITFFAKPLFLLLDMLYNLCGNWGWAIVLLTLIVRVVLYPLTYKGMVSMQKLKDLAPKMKELQQKYKGEPQKLQAHMMELYKKHGANPMGGCLPLILQIPVFFAIYRVLFNAIELKGAEWMFWINDLSIMDPYFVLPILMGATMYLQQHLTPTTFSDPMQEKIFKFLPLIFTIFFVTFPSGLVLYWFVNNIFSILQQLLINKSLERKKALEIAKHKGH
ncbi:MAG: membrane protein insertase YidC [Helicobacteraceae bacterium]|nr:membrane protein insertase YidC [Helicobacteraceae bacterium]